MIEIVNNLWVILDILYSGGEVSSFFFGFVVVVVVVVVA